MVMRSISFVYIWFLSMSSCTERFCNDFFRGAPAAAPGIFDTPLDAPGRASMKLDVLMGEDDGEIMQGVMKLKVIEMTKRRATRMTELQ